jgi:ribosomal protein S8E
MEKKEKGRKEEEGKKKKKYEYGGKRGWRKISHVFDYYFIIFLFLSCDNNCGVCVGGGGCYLHSYSEEKKITVFYLLLYSLTLLC